MNLILETMIPQPVSILNLLIATEMILLTFASAESKSCKHICSAFRHSPATTEFTITSQCFSLSQFAVLEKQIKIHVSKKLPYQKLKV